MKDVGSCGGNEPREWRDDYGFYYVKIGEESNSINIILSVEFYVSYKGSNSRICSLKSFMFRNCILGNISVKYNPR